MNNSLTLPYTATRNSVGYTIFRPFLPLTLLNATIELPVVGLLDTGADVNILPYTVGVNLGLAWENQPNISSISGNLANYSAKGAVISATIGSFKAVQLAFAWVEADTIPLILGQTNFFTEFNICFFGAQRSFEVSPKQ